MERVLVSSQDSKSNQNIILILALIFSIKTLLASYDYVDVLITRTLQGFFEDRIYWAEILNISIRYPFVIGVILITVILGIGRWGLKVSLTQISLSYLAAHLLNMVLKKYVYVYKPDLDLVEVAAYSSASGWPATFILVYGAIWGCFLFDQKSLEKRPFRYLNLTGVLALITLILSVCASILLGGNWPTQILASLFMGIYISVGVSDLIRFGQEEVQDEDLPPLNDME